MQGKGQRYNMEKNVIGYLYNLISIIFLLTFVAFLSAKDAEYWEEKSECMDNRRQCMVSCLANYGIDYYQPGIFSPMRSTYMIVCKKKCDEFYDCNAAYNRLKEKGVIQ